MSERETMTAAGIIILAPLPEPPSEAAAHAALLDGAAIAIGELAAGGNWNAGADWCMNSDNQERLRAVAAGAAASLVLPLNTSVLERIRVAIFVGTQPDPGWPTPDHPECVRRAEMVMCALTNAGFVIVPREPTEAMMDATYAAGLDVYFDADLAGGRRVAAGVLQAMIDAALDPASVAPVPTEPTISRYVGVAVLNPAS